MITTGFESRVKIQQIVENQLPEFLVTESPKSLEFLKQYYISQEYQGGPVDIVENLDQYTSLDNFTQEVISGITTLTSSVSSSDTEVYVESTKGFPKQYGIFKLNDEIITYTGITTNSFTGCIRGFSGITSYRSQLDPEELVFSESTADNHEDKTRVHNLSALFLKEFYRKLKVLLAPGFEDVDFLSSLNVNNFLKQIRNFYQLKGTDDAFRILFNVLYGQTPKVINLEDFLLKPSDAEYIRREILVTEVISGNPNNLVGQVIRNDSGANGPVSEVEILFRRGKTFYKVQLFTGFSEKSLIEGTFEVTPKSIISNPVSVGSSVITVDSTIGFPESGNVVVGTTTITYTNKSVNQFFGCEGVVSSIPEATDIRSDNIVYGYENGDKSKPVYLRVTGVLSDIDSGNDFVLLNDEDVFRVKYLGDSVKDNNKTYKEFAFNSWLYNTRARYEIESFTGNQLILHEVPDDSSLKIGDTVDVLDRNSENVIVSEATVTSITNRPNQSTPRVVFLDKSITGVAGNRKLSVRRRYDIASASAAPLNNTQLLANVQNTYNQNDEYLYVASNSLPDYSISQKLELSELNITTSSNLDAIFQGYNPLSDRYSIIAFPSNVSFLTGDEIIYTGTGGTPIPGLTFGEKYFVEVIRDGSTFNKIKLFTSRSFIAAGNHIEIGKYGENSVHTFTLKQHFNKTLTSKKSLVKIPLNPNIESGTNVKTKAGTVGTLINGVDIINYKSNDYLYYGPVDSLKVYNGGRDYDVINPPQIQFSRPGAVGVGTTALGNVVVRGSIKEVIVDPQDEFNVNKVLSVSLVGGNGSGAQLQPVLTKRFREIEFSGNQSTVTDGGVNITNETITFKTRHNLVDGEKIVYNRNGNEPIGISSFKVSNADQNDFLISGAIYFPQVINTKSIYLYKTEEDYRAGINTVGFTTTNTSGVHKFRLFEAKNVLSEVKVINSGSGYENRLLRINPSGISTVFNTVNFKNHGFNDGDLITYNYEEEQISGLSTSNYYYVLKIDDSSFRLADAGSTSLRTVGAANTNYLRRNFVTIDSSGSGYQKFAFPPVELVIDAEYGGGTIGTITATPIVRGEIIDAYVYDGGTDYGSEILNFEKRPDAKILNGKSAQLKPIVKDGKIAGVEVQSPGKEYFAAPDLVVNGQGSGAKLRAEVSNGRITNVIIINSGVNYSENDTSVSVNSPGRNGVLNVSIRPLSINNEKRFSDELFSDFGEDLSYGIVGYSTDREGVSFSDVNPNTGHSKVIGWAHDGNPIYGPFGNLDPKSSTSPVTLLKTSYTASSNNVKNRPSEKNFPLGFFVEDYSYTGSGDLDSHNGRFSITPEFPNGVYAYYVGVATDLSTGKLIPDFPYFVGDTYRSNPIENTLSQSFDFNSSNLLRNTFPYRVGQKNSNNDFITESNAVSNQTTSVESVSSGSVDSIKIVVPGVDYKVGNIIDFNNDNTDGGGAIAEVTEIEGKSIVKLTTTYDNFDNSVLTWEDSNTVRVHTSGYQNLRNLDIVNLSGLSTFVSNVEGSHHIGVSSQTSYLVDHISPNVGVVTDIYVTSIDPIIGSGTTIGIGSEVLTTLNIFKKENIIRVKRDSTQTGTAHSISDSLIFYANSFTVPAKAEYFDSKLNTKVFFNPTESIAVGINTGIETEFNYHIGKSQKTVSIPTQSIFIPNHPFKNNQRVLFTKLNGSNALVGYDSENDISINVPSSGNTEYLYIVNKSKDFIGLTTQVGLTSTSNGLFFTNNGSDSYEYSLEPTYDQVTVDVKKIVTQVAVSTVHSLSDLDSINLSVRPNKTVGIGNSDIVRIKYDTNNSKILVNPVGFTSDVVNTATNQINLTDHRLKTGQKVFYKSQGDNNVSGLTTAGYFVLRIDDDHIKLAKTFEDIQSNPPRTISIGNSGGNSQELSLLNPQLIAIKNNNLTFDVSDTSLSGYKFKVYYDRNLSNEFVSTGTTSVFSTVESGIVGVTTGARFTIQYNDDLPTKLYYALEKDGEFIPSDTEVVDYSEIVYDSSKYDGSYNIFGIGSTTFQITLDEVPESLSYRSDDCFELEYSTTSLTEEGPIKKIDIISGGNNYTKLPTITGISTGLAGSVGSSADVLPETRTIGKLNDFRIINEGFEYSSDKTLRPTADIDRYIGLNSADKISKVDVLNGGRNYISPPKLVLVNSYTNKVVESGLLEAKFKGNTITSVEIVEEPKGLSNVEHRIYATNNSNGIQVERVTSYDRNTGVVEVELSTPPVTGFVVAPFKAGDRVFVEGIAKGSVTDDLGRVTSPGSGFNSAENGYKFFEVTEYTNSNPAILKYYIGEFTDNAGNIITNQTAFTSIVKNQSYPVFKITKKPSLFFLEETLIVNDTNTELEVSQVNKNYVKVRGDQEIKVGDLLTGSVSGNFATVNSIISYDATFNVDYSNEKSMGWNDNIGSLNDDLQVIPDNNYYQNLSYTLKSPVEWETQKEAVNKLVHPSGLKNFADVEISSKSSVSIGATQSLLPILDFVSEERVDAINNFDLVRDYDPTAVSSRFITFKNKRLTDYIECKTNRVLQIDDISGKFSSAEFNKDTFVDVLEYPITDFYSKFLIQVIDEGKTSTQASEVVVLNNFDNTFTLSKTNLHTADGLLGEFSADFGFTGDPILKFTPENPNDFNYNIKVYRENFSINPGNIGVGFTDFGFLRLSGKTETVGPSGGGGQLGFSTTVFRANSYQYDTVIAYAHVHDLITNEMNYFEVAGYYDGDNTHISEYYFDTKAIAGGISGNFIGTFGINVSDQILRLTFENENSNNDVRVKVKTVGIGSTALGIGTHRFTVEDQIDGTERTARTESNFDIVTGISTIISYDLSIESTMKSIVRVAVGSTVAVHNLLVVSDQLTSNIQHYPFLSVGSQTGIGTFGSKVVGDTVVVDFYPDSDYSSEDVLIQSVNQMIYTDIEEFNDPDKLTYGTAIEDITNSFYGSINQFGKDKLDFDLNYSNIPIFEKTFNPKDTTVLNRATGVFTINDHFFETGEELIYTPNSTLVGKPGEAVGIGSTIVSGAAFKGDFIVGFTTVTGIGNSTGLSVGSVIFGPSVPASTTEITGIKTDYTYFTGNTVAAGSSIITGVGNTAALTIGSGIFSGDNTSLGNIYAVGVNSITSTETIQSGTNRIYYSTDENFALELDGVSIGSTFRKDYSTGISTDICPERVYAIRLTKDTFKITGTSGGSGVGFTFTSIGSGNRHELEMKKKNEKAIITVDGVTQYPIAYTPLVFTLQGNDSTIGTGVTFLSLSGISSIAPKDILEINDEFIRINNVGIATTNAGPINGLGDISVVEVTRGVLGTAKTTLTEGAEARIYKGAFNIVGNKIHFSEAPDGRGNNDRLNSSNLNLPKSSFNGRVYLRNDYTNNKIYDDISLEFNGIGRTFTVYREGQNTTGLEAGSNLVFINDVFQTPDTTNNAGNNYSFQETSSTGISSVTFTGITRENTDDIITVESDVNQNQLPRGGVVVSLAATGGLGYAPLVGAKLRAETTGGVITNIVGVPTYGQGFEISTSKYNKDTGILEITTSQLHKFTGSEDEVYLENLEFSCAAPHAGVTTTIFPDGTIGNVFPIVGIISATTFNVNIGVSTIAHNYVGHGSAFPYFSKLNFGSGYANPISIGVSNQYYQHKFVSAGVNSITDDTSGTHTASNASYDPVTGVLILTIEDHGLSTSNTVEFDDNSLSFKCSSDNFQTTRSYPRSTDPVSGISTEILATTTDTITVNIGETGGTGAQIAVSVGAGGTLIPSITSGGQDYGDITFDINDPSYENLPVIGVSRLGVGNTTTVGVGLSMTFEVGPNGSVGIGSTLFEISNYEITKNGYSFMKGDKFKIVGLVTDGRLSEPISEIEFEVIETFTDSFSSWQLGEFDYIDSIKSLQNGKRTRFPLFKNSQLLSFQKNVFDVTSSLIDFDAILLIYVNGVMQEPKVSYVFEGGTTFRFIEPPKSSDKVDIFFYRGTRGTDSVEVDVDETIKVGDTLTITKNNQLPDTETQDSRIVASIIAADTVETGIYLGDGINDIDYKPVQWLKQKRDLLINDNAEYKSRDSIEGMVFPTARIIKDLGSSDSEVFVDNAQFFNYEENESSITIQNFSGIVIPNGSDPVAAGFTANVSAAGTIGSITVLDSGSGYTPGSTVTLKIGKPVGGIGTIFKDELPSTERRVGTIGIRSDVITGINTELIKVGQSVESVTNIFDTTFEVTGITSALGGSLQLNKNSFNTALNIKQFKFGRYQEQTLAEGTATVSAAGSITSTNITKAGAGYTTGISAPVVIAPIPNLQSEVIDGIRFVQGFSGIITGISTNTGTSGNSLAMTFYVKYDPTSVIDGLLEGYPIYVQDTHVGHGVTSIDSSDDAIVGVGTTASDNIYYIHSITRDNLVGIITSNILSTSNTVGVHTMPNDICGRFSWGRLSGFSRIDNAVSVAVTGYSVSSGLSTFPTLQRRKYGLRDTGALRKTLLD